MKKLILASVMLLIGVSVGVTCACKAGIITPPYIGYANVWSVAVCEVDGPFGGNPLEMTSTQVITADDITDIDARLVADPFLIRNDGRSYLFYEVMNGDTGQGDIGLSSSADGRTWDYESIVLDEDFHLSYPQVFRHNNEFFMVPESSAVGSVRLYRATQFPTEWQYERTLIEKPLVDATVLKHNDRWWMFASPVDAWDDLYLYSSEDLISSEWQEHPQSPIVRNSERFARPGGRIIKEGDRLFRIAQDHKRHYGHQLWALEINKLTVDEYDETLTSQSPILTADGDGWNEIGMHHLDLHVTPDGNRLMCVDGLERVLRVGPLTLND